MYEREKFEKWVKNTYPNDLGLKIVMLNNDEYFEVWQAALSTRKSCGFGIADKDGDLLDLVPMDKQEATQLSSFWNDDPRDCMNPHRVVELFYEDKE